MPKQERMATYTCEKCKRDVLVDLMKSHIKIECPHCGAAIRLVPAGDKRIERTGRR